MNTGSKKILVIEDDPSLQDAYKAKFETEGFIVIQAEYAEDGVKKAREHKPDCILLDILLPGGMDGMNVCLELKKMSETKHIPIIMMTNVDDQISTSLDIGAVWYFVKSETSLDTLVEKIREIFSHI